MLNVLIIDDERNIRENLKSLINWESYGFTVSGEAENGNDGMEKFEALKPELVITDIRMPGIDGLEMISRMKKQNPRARIIIISGYSLFDYAKQAITFGVDGYLLKPIDENELTNHLDTIRDLIEKEQAELILLEKSRNLRQGDDLVSILRGTFSGSTASLPGDFAAWKSYQLFVLRAEDDDLLTPEIREKIRKLIRDKFLKKYRGFLTEIDTSIVCLFEGTIDYFSRDAFPHAGGAEWGISNTEIALYADRPLPGIDAIAESYNRILKAIEKRFFYTCGNRILIWLEDDDKKKRPVQRVISMNDLAEQLFMAIDLNEEKEIGNVLEKIERKYIDEKPEETRVKGSYISLYHTIMTRITAARPNMNHLLDDYEQMILKIGSARRISGLSMLIREKLTAISFELCVTRSQKDVVERVLGYIGRNYFTTIKLKLLSGMFHYNTAYFGQLFKETTGSHFNAYLDRVRIEKAKEFLRKGLKVYEVAEKTGFSDVDNFHKKFRKITGVSPSVFRKKILG